MVVREFEWRADVDDLVEIGQAIEGNKQVFQGAARRSARMGRGGLSHAGNQVAMRPAAPYRAQIGHEHSVLLRSNYRVRIFGR
jgi:hypothetical protein